MAERPNGFPVDEQTTERIDALAEAVRTDFEAHRRVLTFDEWFELLCEHPEVHARDAARYVRDAFDHFGRDEVRVPSGRITRFRIFDRAYDGGQRLVGQEQAQNEIYEALSGYCRLGRVNSLVLLHGPNGSAKSTILECVQRGLEAYSHTEEGAQYRFAWVFPTREPKGGGIGFGAKGVREVLGDESFARLGGDRLDARLADESKDHPIFLIPPEARQQLLEQLLGDRDGFVTSDRILNGDLSARNRQIYDALLASYQGDLRKVLQHVQVERFFLSRDYRLGLVEVEPKQTVDARSYPVTGDRAFASLPASVGGQALYGAQGDLVDANRGVITYSDLLKRPYEHYKYLLTATESGRVALDHVMLNLDLVFTGSANDVNLLEFREGRTAEYQSFRARLDLIPVAYLLDYRVERKIYEEQVGDLLRGVHVAPHVPRILALWGVMTRLRRPDPARYTEKIRSAINELTPIDKADLYAYGRVPEGLSSDEARELLAAVPQMFDEPFGHVAVQSEAGRPNYLGDYEGSFGASVRDLKNLLLGAASASGVTAVTVPRLFQEIEQFLKDRANNGWMRLDAEGNFHRLDMSDEASLTRAAYERWLDLSDEEVRRALGLVDEERYLELFRKYVLHVSHYLKKERIFDEVTGDQADPDAKFMGDLEESMTAGKIPDRDQFRADVMGRIGAWALSHPDADPAFDEIFPDYFARMREDYYRQQRETVSKGIQYMLERLREEKPRDLELSDVEMDRAKHALEVLCGDHDGPDSKAERHTAETLKETLVALSRHRY